MDTNLAIAAFAATVSFLFMVWGVGRNYRPLIPFFRFERLPPASDGMQVSAAILLMIAGITSITLGDNMKDHK